MTTVARKVTKRELEEKLCDVQGTLLRERAKAATQEAALEQGNETLRLAVDEQQRIINTLLNERHERAALAEQVQKYRKGNEELSGENQALKLTIANQSRNIAELKREHQALKDKLEYVHQARDRYRQQCEWYGKASWWQLLFDHPAGDAH